MIANVWKETLPSEEEAFGILIYILKLTNQQIDNER